MKTGSRPVLMSKPFDARAEGLVSERSRDDRTAIELFLKASADLTVLAFFLP
jgi:hypothetical protein